MANKKQGYTTIAYPESLAVDWEKQLNELPFGYCYCLHDRDVDENGEIKKAHIHIYFQGSPTAKQKAYISSITTVTYGEDVRSLSAVFDYMTHENNNDKYHYSRDSIMYSMKWCQEMFDAMYVPKRDVMQELWMDIINNSLADFSEVVMWYMQNKPNDMSIVTKNAYAIREFTYQLQKKE